MGSLRTLRVTWPLGRPALDALLILLVLLGGAELLLRQPTVRRGLPPPSIGSGNSNIDLKLEGLRRFVERDGRLDYLFMGSSMLDSGIDPDVFDRRYAELTGRVPHGYNFGIAALNGQVGEKIGRILLAEYQPRRVIWGLTPMDYTRYGLRQGMRQLDQNPWINYRLGDWTFDGWLTDNLLLYRYSIRWYMELTQPVFVQLLDDKQARMTAAGFTPIDDPPRLQNLMELDHGQRRRWQRLSRVSLDRELFRNLMALHGHSELIFAELPAHPRLLAYLGDGTSRLEKDLQAIRQMTVRAGIPLIPPPEPGFLPDGMWYDFTHLTPAGAARYSAWLAERLAALDLHSGRRGDARPSPSAVVVNGDGLRPTSDFSGRRP
ncbi:MAG: hypothetical protein JXQ27_03665 [Acidobacteria bacterium]|nr:hypothetical protein [Acidobacteriota bacterium]